MKRTTILLCLIIFLAAFLRFFNLESTPPSLSHDEVAIGYNAWSILQTGKDEYGKMYPILFQSFDDFKLPGYIYATVLSEKLFGLTPFAVRFTSALLGTLTVVALYFLIKTLLKENIALVAAFLLAISPWHINFSRAAFESNGSVFFLVLGTLFLFLSLKKPSFLIYASFSFVASLYFYYTARVLIPFILLAFFLSYKKELLAIKKTVVLSIVVGFIALSPLLPHMFSSGLSRVNQVSIFEEKTVTLPYQSFQEEEKNSLISKVFYNDKMAYMVKFVDNYLKNFNPDYYFSTGTGPMGLLYVWELPFLLSGVVFMFSLKQRWKWVILAWFFATPIVGGLTMGQPNALRTLPNCAIVPLFTALGLFSFSAWYKKLHQHTMITGIVGVIILFFFLRFMHLYFVYYPPKVAGEWGDGHKELAQFLKTEKTKYEHVYVTGEYWRPYIYLFYYTPYDPAYAQKKGSRYGIDNISFGKASWDRGEGMEFMETNLSLLVKNKTLFVLTPAEFARQQELKAVGKVPYTLLIVKEIGGKFVHPAFIATVLE